MLGCKGLRVIFCVFLALHLSSAAGHEACVDILLRVNDLDRTITDCSGLTAEDLALEPAVRQMLKSVAEWLWSLERFFQLSAESNPGVLWLCFTVLCDWLKKSRHILNLWDARLWGEIQLNFLRDKVIIFSWGLKNNKTASQLLEGRTRALRKSVFESPCNWNWSLRNLVKTLLYASDGLTNSPYKYKTFSKTQVMRRTKSSTSIKKMVLKYTDALANFLGILLTLQVASEACNLGYKLLLVYTWGLRGRACQHS